MAFGFAEGDKEERDHAVAERNLHLQVVHKLADRRDTTAVIELKRTTDDGKTILTDGRFFPYPADRGLVARFHPVKITPVSSGFDFPAFGMTVMATKVSI